MNMNLSNYMNSGAPIREHTAARGISDAAGSVDRGGQETLNFKAGEQIRGTVVETDGNRVVIETKDHGMFSASLENGMQVNRGDVMDFEVRGMVGKQIALTPLYSNMSVDSSVLKALQAAALPATDANIRMVNEMMNQGMGIDRGALHTMAGLIGQYGKADPVLLVQMRQMGIPISEDSVAQMMSYRNNTAQIVSSFGEIGGQFLGLLREMAANQEYGALGRLFTETMKLIVEDELSGQNTQSSQAENTVNSGQENVLQAGSGSAEALQTGSGSAEAVQAGSGQTEAAQTSSDQTEAAQAGSGQTEALQTGSGQAGGVQTDGAAPFGNTAMQQAGGTGADVMAADPNRQTQARIQVMMTQDGMVRMQEMPGEAIPGQTQEAASDRDGTRGQVQSYSGEADPAAQFMNHFLDSLGQKTDRTGEATWHRNLGIELETLLKQPQFEEAFQKALTSKWLLAPQDVAGKEQVKELYEQVLRQTIQMQKILESAGKQDSTAMKSLRNVERNVEFLNELNQHFAYVQLPLKMSEQNAHGDLYVYTNKKGFAGRDGAVTAFLHLGMDHLGEMDIYVALQQNKVSTKFYLEDDSIIDFLEGHMEELDARLAGKGYSMKSELLHKDHEDGGNVFDQMLADSKSAGAAPMVMLSRQSFDARA